LSITRILFILIKFAYYVRVDNIYVYQSSFLWTEHCEASKLSYIVPYFSWINTSTNKILIYLFSEMVLLNNSMLIYKVGNKKMKHILEDGRRNLIKNVLLNINTDIKNIMRGFCCNGIYFSYFHLCVLCVLCIFSFYKQLLFYHF
jgi:hypothetical protein